MRISAPVAGRLSRRGYVRLNGPRRSRRRRSSPCRSSSTGLPRIGRGAGFAGDAETLTYAALAELSHRYSRWALRQNIGHGDVVALVMPNCPAYARSAGHYPRRRRRGARQFQPRPPRAAHSIRIVTPKQIIVASQLEGALAEALPMLPPEIGC